MSRVQRVPRELLALLGIVGENPPADLLNEYRGTIEMIHLIIASLPLEQVFAFDAAAVLGTSVAVVVPEGEAWFVEGAQASLTFDSTVHDALVSLRWSGGHLARQALIAGQTVPTLAAAVTVDTGWSAGNGLPLVMRAGQDVVGRLASYTGAGVSTLTTFVNFRRIPV